MSKINSVLLVDDNCDDNEIHSFVLLRTAMVESEGQLFIRNNGQEALDFFKNAEESNIDNKERFPPHLIFLDINMPLMNGFEFLKEFEHILSDSPFYSKEKPVVIMLTSSQSEFDRKKSKEFSIVKDFVEKPLTKEKAKEIATIFFH